MMENRMSIIEGRLLHEENDLNLLEISTLCKIDPEAIVEFVEEGILEPSGTSREDWRFKFVSVIRLKRARRLRVDLELNTPGVALALQLLEKIEALEERLRS